MLEKIWDLCYKCDSLKGKCCIGVERKHKSYVFRPEVDSIPDSVKKYIKFYKKDKGLIAGELKEDERGCLALDCKTGLCKMHNVWKSQAGRMMPFIIEFVDNSMKIIMKRNCQCIIRYVNGLPEKDKKILRMEVVNFLFKFHPDIVLWLSDFGSKYPEKNYI